MSQTPDNELRQLLAEKTSECDTLRKELELLQEEFTKKQHDLENANNKLNEALQVMDQKELRLKIAQEASYSGAWEWNIVENSFYWSEELLAVFGFSPEDPYGFETWRKSVHPDDVEAADQRVLVAIDTKTDLISDYRIIKPDKSIHWIRTFAKTFYKGDTPLKMIGFCIDITEQKKKEKELKDIRDRYDMATKIGRIGTWDWNLLNDDLQWNDVTYELLGFKPGGIIPNYELYLDIVHPEDRAIIRNAIKESFENNADYSVDHRIVLDSGEIRYCFTTGKVDFDISGKPIRMLGTFQDITTRKKTEQELFLAKEKAEESDRLKSEFLRNMSHEVRTPMNGIVGFCNLLNENNVSEPERRQFLSVIQSSCFQLKHIIDDILEISILETRQVKANETELNLNDFLIEQFSLFTLKAKERGVQLYIKKGLEDDESNILSDRAKLQKVINNILENAFKFTFEGFIEIGYFLENEEIILYVKDTGIGINKENFERIFVRFSQEDNDISKKAEGLGLGLSIAKENAELLGGRITVESEKGTGTIFYVTIPYHALKISNPREIYENGMVQSDDIYKVLVAEDESINFLYIETVLKRYDAQKLKVYHAKDGLEAVEIFKKNTDIRFIIMDIKMPNMDGFEATREIRKMSQDIPIIAVTAYSTLEDKEKAVREGCNEVVIKPLDIDTFRTIIKKYTEMTNI